MTCRTTCRHCSAPLQHVFVDLGTAPPSNAYLDAIDLAAPETYLPLEVMVCDACWLVQTRDVSAASDLFTGDYAYFSAVSSTWLAYSEAYVAKVVSRFGLDASSRIVEVASNDGYLLQYVVRHGVPCYGIEPTHGTAQAARARGIEVVEEFFGSDLARRLRAAGRGADLIVANNVLAHVPDINDFCAGFPELLHPEGVATFEFPHLLELVTHAQFDTIYHEHYSYLSLQVVTRILDEAGLAVFDVETLPTHGGSLRVFAQHARTGLHRRESAVDAVLTKECAAGLQTLAPYEGFQARADAVKDGLLDYLLRAKREGRRVAAYGAAAKGNTLLNYAGVRGDLLPYVVDANPHKQGRYLPGSRIPIVPPAHLLRDKPDEVLVLPWNLADEIVSQLGAVRRWGGRFVAAVPNMREIG